MLMMMLIMEKNPNQVNFFKAVRIASGLPLPRFAMKAQIIPAHYKLLEKGGKRADLSTLVRVKRAAKLDWAVVGQFMEQFVGEE